jgi:hypothetical protein
MSLVSKIQNCSEAGMLSLSSQSTNIRGSSEAAQDPPPKSPEQRQHFSGQKTWMFFEYGHGGNVFMRPEKNQLVGIRILAGAASFW